MLKCQTCWVAGWVLVIWMVLVSTRCIYFRVNFTSYLLNRFLQIALTLMTFCALYELKASCVVNNIPRIVVAPKQNPKSCGHLGKHIMFSSTKILFQFKFLAVVDAVQLWLPLQVCPQTGIKNTFQREDLNYHKNSSFS